jgi:hypothetical protein
VLALGAEHMVSGHISGLRLMRRVLQRTRGDGNAMCIRRGFPLSLALRFPITNTHTHNFYFHARTPVSLSPELLLLCVASIIRIPYSIYTPAAAAGGAALDKIRRTHRKNKIASQPEEKLHYTHFILRPHISMEVVVVVWEMLPRRRWKYDDIRRIKVNKAYQLVLLILH